MDNKGKGVEKIKSHYNLPDYYRYYKETTFGKDKDHPYFVERKLFNMIVKDYMKEVSRKIIYENYEYKIPCRLGVICIRKFKPKNKIEDGVHVNNLPVDMGATMKLWRTNPKAKEKKVLLRHLNKHSDGYVAKFCLIKHTANFRNKSLYNFVATRTNKRTVASIMKNLKSNIDYFKL